MSPLEDHWALRREAAALLAAIAAAFAAPHHNLTPRLCKLLAQAWLGGDKPLPCKYGAVVGLQVCVPPWGAWGVGAWMWTVHHSWQG